MCWNEHVSLNTFLFSTFVLGLVIYNNAYTPYKIPNMAWPVYLFMFSFIIMQLNEYFLWRNLKDTDYNRAFSIAGIFILFFQPVFSLMMIEGNPLLSVRLIFAYLLGAIPFMMYNITHSPLKTDVSKEHHLLWRWSQEDMPIINYVTYAIWLFFLFFSMVYNGWWLFAGFGAFTYLYMLFRYVKTGTVGSMWCWVINSAFLLFAFLILLYYPIILG